MGITGCTSVSRRSCCSGSVTAALTLLAVLGIMTVALPGQAVARMPLAIEEYQFAQPASDVPAPSGRGATVLFFDDMESGTNGWTTVDEWSSSGSPQFHVDGYMAYRHSGSSWWCGSLDFDTDGGYGNSWDERLDLPQIDLTGYNTPVIAFKYRSDVEPDYDYAYVEVKKLDGTYKLLASYTGDSDGWLASGPISLSDPLSEYCAPVEIRFRVNSDAAWSDEDGIWPTVGGAFMCDSIRVYDYSTNTTLFYEDCEDPVQCTPSNGSGGNYWHIISRACGAHSRPHSWWCGSDADTTHLPGNISNSLVSPSVDISALEAGTPCTLKFRVSCQIPYLGYPIDYLEVLVSTDDGNVWVNPTGSVSVCDLGCFTHTLLKVNLTALIPDSPDQLQVKWSMNTTSDGCGPGVFGGAGVTVDDVQVVAWLPPSGPLNVPEDYATIQEAIEAAEPGDEIVVAPGTYTEGLVFDASFAADGLVISGGDGAPPVVTGGIDFLNTSGIDGISFDNIVFTGGAKRGNALIDFGNSGPIYDFVMTDCVIDGENVAGRHGLTGNLLGGTFTVTGCEVKNILGWSVLDMDDSSDYTPWGGNGLPLTAVTFSDNYIHDCNGSVSLRGHYPTRTTQVNVHDNTFTNIGGNHGETGEQWAAIEVNHAVALSFRGNVIDDVDCGLSGEGQAVQLWDIGTVDMHNNSFASCCQGLYVFAGQTGDAYGGPYAIPAGSVSYNNISGNTEYGLKVQDTATGGPLHAELNWWGDATGPEVAKGAGDMVIGDVTFDPWIGKSGGENVVCDPDPLSLKVGSTTGQVAVKYLGGGSGLVFGYSVTVSWDAAKVSLTGITEGGLLKDAVPPNGTFFFVYGTGNTRTIDCSILGSLVHPGVTGPGTMFTLNFSAVGYGESPVDVTILAFRDNTNTDLFGFYEDDGLIKVDITNPVVTNVHIANLTLSHTDDYAKNHDSLELTATVTDDYPLTTADITADLSLLLSGGGTVVPAQGYNPVSHVATWTTALADVMLTADGSHLVTVTAKDGLGNTGTGSDAIIVDNTLPGSVEGFAAAPGHEKVHLSWTDASGKDTNYYGVIVRYEAWGDYPEYETAPAYPASYTAGDGEAFSGTGTVATHVIVPPDIHYYSAFVYDWALNYGPVTSAGQDRATNYWLGDVAIGLGAWGYNGLVDAADIDKLAGQYGSAPTDLFNRCDVGPSDDHSRLGIPLPNDFINFEDLMMFAMNYDVVSPAGKIVPFLGGSGEGELALSLEELVRSPEGEVQVALRLGGNVGDVKGISSVITYDASQLEFVSARLSDAMSSPLADMFFWSGLEDGRVQVDLAVLGTGVAIGGSGDVAVLTFRTLGGEYALGFDEALIRGVENEELTGELQGLESRPEVPTVFRLSQNVPNPFNPKTVVAYEVPQACEVAIRVYDVSGRLVRTLVDGTVEPGRYAVEWDGVSDRGESVGSGVYFCVMDTPDYHATNKMMLLK